MNVEFPLFGFEKDDHSMFLIEKPERILYHLEAIDLENDEYLFLGFDWGWSPRVDCKWCR